MTDPFLEQLLTTWTARTRHVALRYRDQTYTYGALEKACHQAAGWLRRQGLTPGERVILSTPAKLPFVLAYWGTLLAGGVPVPLSPQTPASEWPYFLQDSGARWIIAGDPAWTLLPNVLAALPAAPRLLADRAFLEEQAPPIPVRERRPEDPCLLLYSSGTTGWPKGVVHTPANLMSSLRALADCWRFTPDDRVLHVLPLFHIHGLSFALHLTWLTGGCVLLEDSFHPLRTLEQLSQATVFMGVPTMYYRWLQEPAFTQQVPCLSAMRLFTCGSAPLRPELVPQLKEILGQPLINRYGMTEAHVITSLPLDGPWPADSVGRPLEGIELRLVTAEGRETAPGEVGHVQIRGPNLFREYWGRPEATRQAWIEGWFDTGDLGFQDAHGFLTLTGRRHDLIIVKGYNVYPQMVERILHACPGVREAAVVGLPDPIAGERVAAVIVPQDPTLTEAQIRAYCAEHLLPYQQPRVVVLRAELPRNALGKVLRSHLRDDLQRQLGQPLPSTSEQRKI